MCHHKLLKWVHTQTQTQKVCRRMRTLWHLPALPCHPLTRVFALFITSPLALHPITSSLPVSNSNQSVGRRGGGGGGRSGRHTKEQPMGVSTMPEARLRLCTLDLLTEGHDFRREFSCCYDCLSPGKCYVISGLIDESIIFIHLSAALNHLAILSLMIDVLVKPVLCNSCAVVWAHTLKAALVMLSGLM